MLPEYLSVLYRSEKKASSDREYINKLKTLPVAELMKIASGEPTKLAYAIENSKTAYSGDNDSNWLEKYKGTPLFSKAVEMEKSLLELDMAEQQERAATRAQRPEPSDIWAKRDAICLQKRMLDLDLVMSQNGGGEPAAPEAKEEQAIGELEQAQAQEAAEGGGADAAHEQQEDAAIQQLQAAHAGGGEQPAPPKPKAPPQAQVEVEEVPEEEGPPPPKKDKGVPAEVKQASGSAPHFVNPSSGADSLKASGNRQGAGAADDQPQTDDVLKQAGMAKVATAVAVGRLLAKSASVLTQHAREEIKPKNFAEPKGNGPGDTGKYPIEDKSHAKAALGLVGMHGSSSEKAKVHAAVAKKYPGLAGSEKSAGLDPKLAFSVTEKGHEYDAAKADMDARHAAEHAALLDEMGAVGGRGTKIDTGKVSLPKGLLNILRFAPGQDHPGLEARHQEYVAGKHREGSNAWNPFGGALTPSPHEEGGTTGLLSQFGKFNNPHTEVSKGPHGKAKEAGILGSALSAGKAAIPALAGAAQGAKSLATSAYKSGGLGQVASSFGNVAKNFAMKNPLAAAGIAGGAGLAAGHMLTPSQQATR